MKRVALAILMASALVPACSKPSDVAYNPHINGTATPTPKLDDETYFKADLTPVDISVSYPKSASPTPAKGGTTPAKSTTPTPPPTTPSGDSAKPPPPPTDDTTPPPPPG